MTEITAPYGIKPAQDNQTPWARVFIAAGCHTQSELAGILGIRQPSISVAKRRQAIPAEWLIKLLRLKGINPEWVLTGRSPKRLGPANDEEPTRVLQLTEIRPPEECSSQELVNELVRRALAVNHLK